MKISKYIIIVVALGLVIFLVTQMKPVRPTDTEPPQNDTTDIGQNSVACTEEAKLCPDGSAVSRIGPKCEFAECPVVGTTTGKGGVTGTVTLGPTCPVERVPADPNCAPKPFATSINIVKSGSTAVVKTIQSDSNGLFRVDLDQGSYVLQVKGGISLPKCSDVSVKVTSGQYVVANVYCDTGMR